jgi:hypothetical protein
VATTTVRVDARTHAKLLELSEANGSSLIETVRDAAEALRRQRFAHQVAEELSALREDRSAWADYVAEADSTAVADGIHR